MKPSPGFPGLALVVWRAWPNLKLCLLQSEQSPKCWSMDHSRHDRPGLASQPPQAKTKNSDKQRKACGHIRQWDMEKVQTSLTSLTD